MTVLVTKPNINVRDELNLLRTPQNAGIKGLDVLRAQNMSDLYQSIGANRNLVINGDFRISQRGNYSSSIAATGDQYYVDRFRVGLGGVTANFTHIDTVIEGRSVKALRIAATSSATGYMGFRYTIEEFWKLSGRKVTMSAWVRTNHQSVTFRHDSTTDFGEKMIADGTWHRYSFTYQCPTITQAGRNQNETTFHILTYYNNSVGILSGDYIEIAEVQIELGEVATPFEDRPFASELALCQRYYENSWYPYTSPSTVGNFYYSICFRQTSSTNDIFTSVPFKAQKRNLGTLKVYNPLTGTVNQLYKTTAGAGSNITVSGVLSSPYNLAYINTGTSITSGDYVYFHYEAEAEL